jgi:hypothetical protein
MQKEKENFEDEKNDEAYFENLEGDDDDESEITGGETAKGEVQTEEDLDETGE